MSLKVFVIFEQSALIGLSDEVELIETTEFPMIFLEMVLEVFTFILEELSLLDEMVVLCAIRALLLPTGNVELIFSLIIRPNLKVPVHTTLTAHLKLFRHV